MQARFILISTAALFTLGACVSSKKFKSAQADYQQLEGKYKTFQFSHHALDLPVEGDRPIHHVVEYFGHIGPEFKVACFFDLAAKYLVLAHSVKIHLQGSDKREWTI